MREILFRGKNAKGEWEYGVPLITGLNSEIAYITQANSYDCRVDIDTVGQYIGLTDKNGKKIFEGDIVKVLGKHIDLVVFYKGCFCMDRQLYNYEFTFQSSEQLEVIGNIHDNPELLEADNE